MIVLVRGAAHGLVEHVLEEHAIGLEHAQLARRELGDAPAVLRLRPRDADGRRDVCELARLESARLLNRWVRDRSESLPVILIGDFNTRDSDPPYAALLGDAADLIDSIVVADTMRSLETFRGFEVGSTTPVRIDYIFVTAGVGLRSHAVLDETLDGTYPSDHLPVVVDIELMRR